MGRKRKFSKLLLFAAMLSTIGAGIFGSVPLPVNAAEEKETYTVTFEAYEGRHVRQRALPVALQIPRFMRKAPRKTKLPAEP